MPDLARSIKRSEVKLNLGLEIFRESVGGRSTVGRVEDVLDIWGDGESGVVVDVDFIVVSVVVVVFIDVVLEAEDALISTEFERRRLSVLNGDKKGFKCRKKGFAR